MYAKVFKQLFYGSMYARSDAQLVFVCLLVHSDRDGDVELPEELIAAMTGLGLPRTQAAIVELEGPDEKSRTPELDGRRLERLSHASWHIVNYLKYRGMRDDEERRRQTREAVARHRSKHMKANVSHGKPQKAHAEAEVEAEVEVEVDAKKDTPLVPDGTAWGEDFERFWKAYPHFQRRSLKAEARKRWDRLRGKVDPETVLRALSDSRRADDWEREGGRFVPGAHVWLGRQSWESSDGKPEHNGTPLCQEGEARDGLVFWQGDWRSREMAEYLGWKP